MVVVDCRVVTWIWRWQCNESRHIELVWINRRWRRTRKVIVSRLLPLAIVQTSFLGWILISTRYGGSATRACAVIFGRGLLLSILMEAFLTLHHETHILRFPFGSFQASATNTLRSIITLPPAACRTSPGTFLVRYCAHSHAWNRRKRRMIVITPGSIPSTLTGCAGRRRRLSVGCKLTQRRCRARSSGWHGIRRSRIG